MSSISDVQQLVAGAVYAASGYLLIKDPAVLLEFLRPALAIVEDKTGLKPYRAGVGVGGDQGLALVGTVLLALGFYFGMSVYTVDEKFKRNSTPGRVIFAAAGFHVCQKPHGNSLVALLSLFHLVGAVLMGLTVGWGDGNAVDIEEKERKARLDKVEGKGREKSVQATG